MPEPARDPYRLLGLTLAGKYLLEEYVGSGGMGAVYRALLVDSRRQVAVKILKPDIIANDRECARLFEQEVEAVRRLEHPNIVKLFDSGADQGYSYMVMEWLEGRTLEEAVSAGQLPLERIDRILAQVCDALEAAHAERIIHLDVKPGNIFLLRDGNPDDFIKVIDFGMSRVLTRESGTTVTRFRGTYQYCSPEQFGGRVSSRSDVYSLGATLYHILTGLVPFGTSYVFAKMHRDRELPPLPAIRRVRPDVPPSVEQVIKKALSKKPGERHQSVRLFYEDFHRAVYGATTRRVPRPGFARLSSHIPAWLKSSPAARLAFSLFMLSWLAAGVLLFNFTVDRIIPGQNKLGIPDPGANRQTPGVTPRERNQESRPVRPSGGVSQPATSSPTETTVDARPVASSAVEPETGAGPRLPPNANLNVDRNSAPPEVTQPRGEFIERGEVFVPPRGDAPPAVDVRPPEPSVNAQDEELRLMALVNEERRRRGLKPLAWDGGLSKLAQQHSRDMARQGYLSHVDPDGKDLPARATQAGLRGWKALGENIAYNRGFNDPEGFAVERWMLSDKHRANILNTEYTHAGVGISRADDGRVFLTQVLMKR